VRMTVDLEERSYPIIMEAGGLQGLGPAMLDVLGPVPRAVVVSNPVVAPLHGAAAVASLQAAGMQVEQLLVPDGEVHKNIATWRQLIVSLLALRVDRSTPVIALGGGVTGDIVGFAAATLLRGVPFVQAPTSLLAMVDSAVGGKTGVNTPQGKNLVGAFHQPALVYSAMETLQTLPVQEIRCGLGEVIKHGVIADPDLFEVCATEPGSILAADPDLMAQLVHRSCTVKSEVVSADELEQGRRAVLNLGHTVGHALETVLAHAGNGLPHGECVGIGLVAEASWAVRRGTCESGVPGRISEVLSGLGLPDSAPSLNSQDLVAAAGFDKKARRGKLSTAIIEAIGKVQLAEIDAEEIPEIFHFFQGSD